MQHRDLNSETLTAIEQVLGYLNFSSGATDPGFLRNLDLIYRQIIARDDDSNGGDLRLDHECDSNGANPHWKVAIGLLQEQLSRLANDNATFSNADQATAVLNIVAEQVVPGYRTFHRDLLFHQSDNQLFGPFMLGRIFESVLRQPRPWGKPARVSDKAISELNCFLGHRPLPTLESQKIEPRTHEWVRPVPLYLSLIHI